MDEDEDGANEQNKGSDDEIGREETSGDEYTPAPKRCRSAR